MPIGQVYRAPNRKRQSSRPPSPPTKNPPPPPSSSTSSENETSQISSQQPPLVTSALPPAAPPAPPPPSTSQNLSNELAPLELPPHPTNTTTNQSQTTPAVLRKTTTTTTTKETTVPTARGAVASALAKFQNLEVSRIKQPTLQRSVSVGRGARVVDSDNYEGFHVRAGVAVNNRRESVPVGGMYGRDGTNGNGMNGSGQNGYMMQQVDNGGRGVYSEGAQQVASNPMQYQSEGYGEKKELAGNSLQQGRQYVTQGGQSREHRDTMRRHHRRSRSVDFYPPVAAAGGSEQHGVEPQGYGGPVNNGGQQQRYQVPAVLNWNAGQAGPVAGEQQVQQEQQYPGNVQENHQVYQQQQHQHQQQQQQQQQQQKQQEAQHRQEQARQMHQQAMHQEQQARQVQQKREYHQPQQESRQNHIVQHGTQQQYQRQPQQNRVQYQQQQPMQQQPLQQQPMQQQPMQQQTVQQQQPYAHTGHTGVSPMPPPRFAGISHSRESSAEQETLSQTPSRPPQAPSAPTYSRNNSGANRPQLNRTVANGSTSTDSLKSNGRMSSSENLQLKPLKILVIYYSLHGHIKVLADCIKEGIQSVSGCKAELYRVPETLESGVLKKMHATSPSGDPVLTHDMLGKLGEADGIIFGIPTRFGMMPAQMKAFFDSTGKLWQKGELVGKPAGLFFSTATQGGGQETTALTTITQLTHHGMIYVPIGYSFGGAMFDNSEVHGGSPYGAGTIANGDGSRIPSDYELSMAAHQGASFANIARKLVA